MNRKKPRQGKDVQEKKAQKKRTQEENDTHSKLLKRQPEQQDPSNERDIMFWISDLPDSYILEADQAGKKGKRKGEKRMQKVLWTGIGVSAAAVIGTIGLFGTGKLHLSHVAQNPAQLEKTTLDETVMQGQIETMPEETERLLTMEEETTAFESVEGSNPVVIPDETTDQVATQAPDEKDKQTQVMIGALDAYYGVIVEISTDSICVQGLEDNEANHCGRIEYSKDDIAAVSGSIGDHSCRSVDDLQVGDQVCVIENGDSASAESADKASFQGVAKVIVISRDEIDNYNTTDTQQELMEEAVYYARKLGKKASDTDYVKNMQLSDELMSYVQKAAGLLDAKPTGAMQMNLSDMGSYLKDVEGETDIIVTDEINNLLAGSVATLMLGYSNDTKALAGYGLLSDNQYLNMEIPTTTALWLYYGNELPSVMCAFIPRSGGTEIKVNMLDAASYQNVYDQINVTNENDTITDLIQYLAQTAVIYKDLDTFDYSYLDSVADDSHQTEGLALATAVDTPSDEAYFTKLIDEIGNTAANGEAWDTLADLFTASDEVNTYVKQAQEQLKQVAQESTVGTLQVYQVPSNSISGAFSAETTVAWLVNGYGTDQMAANLVVSKIVHERLAMHPVTKDWKKDVVLKYSLSDVTLLVSLQKADNLYLQINVNFIWHDDKYNEDDLTGAMEQLGLVEIIDVSSFLKEGMNMQNKRWISAGVGAAAVIASVNFVGAGTVSVEYAVQNPVKLEQTMKIGESQEQMMQETLEEPAPEQVTSERIEESTTQDFMDLIEYTKDWQTAEEVTPENAAVEESQAEEMTQADPQTMVEMGALEAYYGTITDVMDKAVLVQGLADNAINDRGSDWYGKAKIAAVSGYVNGYECTSADDLKVGDRVCVIRSGYVEETAPGSFVGIAKFIVISRDVKENEKAADKTLTRAAVRYAQKIAEKAADSDYLDKMELSDEAMQYAKSAAGLSGIAPEAIMEINLEDAISSMFTRDGNINSNLLDMMANLFGNSVNREVGEDVSVASDVLTEDEYLSTYYPLLFDGAVALWLYYGEDLPSVFVTFVPKSQAEEMKVTTSKTTEIRATLAESSAYKQVCALMEKGGNENVIKKALANNAVIYNDLDSFNPLNLNQGYYVGESREAADETFYRTVAYDAIRSADGMNELISGLSNDVEQKLYSVQEILIAALTGVTPGTLEAYYAPTDDPYALTKLHNTAFNAMKDTTNQAMAWNFSQIVHSQMSAYSAREGWDRDVLLVYSFSDLKVLVTIEQGDNNFMKVTPLFIMTEENNENLGSQEQMDSFIQSLLEQYNFEKFDITD